MVSDLVRAELGRVDWAALECGCGATAEHLPLMFEAILTAATPREMIGHTLENHVEVGTNTFPCTPPAVRVIMSALAGEISPPARGVLLQTLEFVAAGSDEECCAGVEEGLWTLLHIGLTGSAQDAETVADICENLGLGGDGSAFYQNLLRERVKARTKRRRV
ncbi:hypothetical protein [Streptomyces griseus]|uniref:hypothetical protein n=1 Tax=Streptomyces griseus TaxID=1911 RepID=UPI00056C230D|nr:hypothetical protein [Streptomyces griseus]